MNAYVDGFVLPLKKDQVEAYRKLAETMSGIWQEYGALAYVECIGDDMANEHGVPFPKLAGCSEDETVVFAWIKYPSREARDAANARLMEDPRMKDFCETGEMPFDFTRMAFGGFKVLVEAGAKP